MDISYIISQMVNLMHVSICIYSSKEGMILRPGQDKGNKKLTPKEEMLLTEIFTFENRKEPAMNRIKEDIFYVSMQVDEKREEWILVGPVLFSPSTNDQLKQARNKLSNLNVFGFEIQKCQMEAFVSGILMLYHFVSGKTMSTTQFWERNQDKFTSIMQMHAKLSENVFERQEKQSTHNPYSQELREIESIQNGDIEALDRSIAETYEGEIGILAKDPLRHHKNVAIGNITMASRAAVRGGVSAELAFSMADSFIQQLEEIDNVSEVEAFKRAAQRAYATSVHELNHDTSMPNNPLIEGVKNYIFSHLHDNIKIEDIASNLRVSPDYLSHLFSEKEKITIKRYILQEKVIRSKNLLCYSDYSLQEIAFYLGFSTQSYFTKIFRELVGMTPGEYRKLLKKRESF